MYSRSFDNRRSDVDEAYEPERDAEAFGGENRHGVEKHRGTGLGRLFGNIKTEDLLLIAIAVLLLMDGDPDNDVLLIVLAVLLFS